jgi:cadmium resistance protein CadD (predicted permease)
VEVIITSIAAFVATNIDDLFLLTLFFGNRNYKSTSIVIGQVLGIATLVVVALAGSIVGNFFDAKYIGWLGLFPIYLGVKHYAALLRNDSGDDDVRLKQNNVVMAVALVTIANGGDNIGVYIPMVISQTSSQRSVMIFIFLVMTLLWCTLARYLAHHPLLKDSIAKCGEKVMPAVLIALGVYILISNGSLDLVIR